MEIKISTGNKNILKDYLLYGVIGGYVGLVTGLIIKKKPVWFAIGGFVLGGYAGHTISQVKSEAKDKVSTLKNYSKTPEKK